MRHNLKAAAVSALAIMVGQRLGPERYYQYFKQFGLLGKTGIDLPGEAGTIMHQPDQIGPVELARSPRCSYASGKSQS